MILKRLSLWAFMLTTISCCLWTTGVYADPGGTPGYNLEETIQGGPCMTDFSVTDLGDCCYRFEDLTPGGGDPGCQMWDVFDPFGNPIIGGMPGPFLDFCFPASGVYVVCFTDCCVLADGTLIQDQICKDIEINCEGCVPDAHFSVTDMGDCCYHFEDLTPESDPNDPCDRWDIYDAGGNIIGSHVGEFFDFCFPMSGVYQICYYDCCINTDGSIIDHLHCIDLEVDCGGCEVDPLFTISDLGDCCYHFEDLTPDPDGTNCQAWDITNASGVVVSSGFGPAHTYCFLTSGTYTICYTDCCIQPDGTMTTATHCETLDVQCQCQPYDIVGGPLLNAITYMDCISTTMIFSISPSDGYCIDFVFNGITYTAVFDPVALTYSVNFDTPCPGDYEGEVIIYCCDNPAVAVSQFVPFTIDNDCCCTPDANFSITDLGDCCYHFEDLTPDPFGNNCSQWEVTDAFGNIILTGHFGQFLDHCFPTGTYTICYTDCCTQADGTQVFATHCETIEVDCGCDVDALFSITDLGDCCYHFEDMTPDPDGNNCSQWEMTDAAGNIVVTGVFGPFFDHCFLANGVYTICYTDCCTQPDGTIIYATHCETIEVECACTPDPNFTATPSGDCCYHFEDLNPADAIDPCDLWEIFDNLGNVIATAPGGPFDFCFPGSGTYVVCYTDCCLNADGTFVSLTHCIDIQVDCCTPDATFTVDPTDDCCYVFADLTPEPDSPTDPCDNWEIFDALGNLIATSTGDIFTYCFQTSGMYVICHTDCCVNADGTITQDKHCIDLLVDCGCTPDPIFSAEPTADCCYHFEDLTPEFDPNDPCDLWEIYDSIGNIIASANGEFFDFCFPGTGVYVVCYTDCCIHPDGTITQLTHCIDIQVDCCTPDATFTVDPTDDCCYVFADLTPEPDDSTDPCDNWEIFDALGNLIATSTGDIFTYCFQTSGMYVICHTDCCVNADGTITQDKHCIDLLVDCGCTPDPIFSAEPTADCCYHFEDLTPELDPNDPCDLWEIYDSIGNIIASANGEFLDFCFPGTGVYVVCYTDCCIHPDGTITQLTHCIDIQVDCCTPDATFTVDPTDDCCYVFADLTPEPDDSTDPCDNWEIFDALGNLIATSTGDIFTYCFQTSGMYVICHTDCCVNADGTITQDTHCIDLVVDCGCEVPDFISFTYFGSWGPDCESGFCLDQVLDPVKYCSTWYWGDGTQSDHPVNVCPVHNYACDGIYDVCVDVYCCEDPSVRVTSCQTVEIDCECNLPSNVDFNILVNTDDCSIGTFINLPDVPCPDEICWTWDMGDGTVLIGGNNVNHTYPTSGTYTVCLNVFCCDDPTIGYTVCHDVTVNCCVVPDFISFTYFGSWGPDCESGFCLDQVLDPTQYCSTWYWGDGTQSDHPVDVCPVHNYACDGIYDVCVDVYCCEDPSVRVTSCQTVEIDCECNLPTDVDFNILVNTDDCSIGTFINLPNVTCPDEVCWTWDMGDGTVLIGGNNVNHTYATSGTYTVCLNVFCCDDPTIGYTVCHDVTVDCCVVPDFISFTYFGTSGANCQAGFCLDQILDPTKYCSTWYWGDGTQSDHPVDECPVHNYLCDGVYEVCVDVYCCEDPSVRVTSCQAIDVDCECNLPADVDFNVLLNADDCSVSAFILMPNVTCPDEICWTWDLGDGTTQVGGTSVNHTYAMSGTYTICLNVYCCDEPLVGYVVCHDVTVDCPPCHLPSFVDFDYTVDACTVTVTGIESDDYDGNLCYSWNWGDGTLDTPGQMATHTYAASGTYIICYTVYCCEDPSVSITVCHEVTVECPGDCPKPCELHSRFLWEMFPITQADGCCMQFFDVSVPGAFTTITSWHWDFGDGNTSTSQNPLHCYDTPGSHTVCLTITGVSPDGICEDVFCWEVICDCEDTCPGDLSGDGHVDLTDLLLFLGTYGQICP